MERLSPSPSPQQHMKQQDMVNNNVNNNMNQQQSIDKYMIYIQKFFNDYQQLQLKHGRLWQSHRELLIKSKQHYHHSHHHNHHRSKNELNDTNNNNDDATNNNNKQDLELMNKILESENSQLVDNVKLFETRYKELLSLCENNKQDKTRIVELENENKELKENIEFLSSENTVLKDSEERAFIEKNEWINEKKKYEQVVVWAKNLNDRYKTLVAKNKKELELFEKFFDSIITQSDSDHELIAELQNLSLKTDENGDKNNANNQENRSELEIKLEILDKYIKNLSRTITEQKIDDNHINSTISNLKQENIKLKDENECLNSEINKLKSLLVERNPALNQETIDLHVKNVELNEKLRLAEEKMEKMNEKFIRNRAVLEENNRRSLDEIRTLDNFISIIIEKLNNLPENLKNFDELQKLIRFVSDNDSETNDK